MRYIMLPIHPKWFYRILKRDKDIEVRSGTTLHKVINRLVKEQGKAPCLAYCTKGDDILLAYEEYDYGSMNYYGPEYALMTKNLFTKKPSKDDEEDYDLYQNYRDAYNYYKNDFDKEQHEHEWKLNGKVVAQFEASAEVISLEEQGDDDFGCNPWFWETDTLTQDELLKRSCLTEEQINDYFANKNSGTAIHIHNLKTFDKPKELEEFKHPCKHKDLDCEECVKLRVDGSLKDKPNCHFGTGIEKAPQSWCYAEVDE